MLNVKQITDLIMQIWAEAYPGKPALAPRESSIVYLVERILENHVILHKDNWQTLETYHQWMRDMQSGQRELSDKTSIICEALNMLDVPRRQSELMGKGTGKRQRIRVVLEDEPDEPKKGENQQ